MSTHSFDAFAWLTTALLVGLMALGTVGLWTSCDLGDESEGGLDKYFLRDAKAMHEMDLPVYWLGKEFTVGGLVFRGPHGAEFGGEVEQGIGMTYTATLEGGGGVPFNLGVQGRDAWELKKDRVLNPRLPGVTQRVVTVGGREAAMISIPSGTRPVNTLWLVLELDEVVVVAEALAGGPVSAGGPDYSPFINNPDLLVQVMQGLRLYPE